MRQWNGEWTHYRYGNHTDVGPPDFWELPIRLLQDLRPRQKGKHKFYMPEHLRTLRSRSVHGALMEMLKPFDPRQASAFSLHPMHTYISSCAHGEKRKFLLAGSLPFLPCLKDRGFLKGLHLELHTRWRDLSRTNSVTYMVQQPFNKGEDATLPVGFNTQYDKTPLIEIGGENLENIGCDKIAHLTCTEALHLLEWLKQEQSTLQHFAQMENKAS